MVYGIVLAGGSGKRLGAEIPKQYIEINGKPLLYYCLKAFEESEVDKVSVVADEEHMQFVVSEIVDKFHFKKVFRVCQGGAERFNSVHHGLDDIRDVAKEEDIVLIHDGARPFITPEEINVMISEVWQHGAAIAAMPVKDTIKVSDDEGFVAGTTIRKNTWQIQTPQGFRYGLIKTGYDRASGMVFTAGYGGSNPSSRSDEASDSGRMEPGKVFTDDSMVVEAIFPDQKIKLVKTSYENIKITTADDLEVAKARL